MNQYLARLAYWKSLGFDTSEGSHAISKQVHRRKLLKKRIGELSFNQWDIHYGKQYAKTDPMFFIGMAIYPLIIIGWAIFLFVFQP